MGGAPGGRFRLTVGLVSQTVGGCVSDEAFYGSWAGVCNDTKWSAVRICTAENATFWSYQDGSLRRVARYKEAQDTIVPIQASGGSVLARMLRSKQLVHVSDYKAEQAYLDGDPFVVAAGDQLGIRTYLGVPVLKDEEIVGAISIYREEVRPLTEKEIELIASFANQAVIAIENARLLNELQQRTDDLSQRTTDLTEALEQQTATSEVLRVISSSPGDLEPVFATMLERSSYLRSQLW